MGNAQPLAGKVALVTGASRGIGQAISLQLAQLGAAVVGTATTQSGAESISAFFESHQVTGKGVVLALQSDTNIESFAETASAAFGTPAILVNNAAVTRDNLMLRMRDEEWHTVIDVNLTSVYRLTKAFLKSMVKDRWGRIVNLTSIVGVTGNAGQANYAAAKAGVIGFTKSLAQELASRNVTVNCVAPGFINTDMTRQLSDSQKGAILSKIPAGRMGEAEEIAYAVSFLASPAAAYITGETIHVNGGMYMG